MTIAKQCLPLDIHYFQPIPLLASLSHATPLVADSPGWAISRDSLYTSVASRVQLEASGCKSMTWRISVHRNRRKYVDGAVDHSSFDLPPLVTCDVVVCDVLYVPGAA